jgi:hypothetical protein
MFLLVVLASTDACDEASAVLVFVQHLIGYKRVGIKKAAVPAILLEYRRFKFVRLHSSVVLVRNAWQQLCPVEAIAMEAPDMMQVRVHGVLRLLNTALHPWLP